jgi:DNA modification methylase
MQGRGYLIRGDARRIPLGDQSVHMAATSPPYLGLRDYGLKPSRWPAMSYRPMVGLPPVEVPALECCLGLEPTPEAFVGHLVLVFREVYRVLRDDGTLWLNLGDSYANDGKWGGETGGKQAYLPDNDRKRVGREKRRTGLAPKNLMGMPWRVAFALQADGWVLRSDVIWAKSNPMPESVTDRPTRAHEYVFLLSKQVDYFYDTEAIREPHVRLWDESNGRGLYAGKGGGFRPNKNNDNPILPHPSGANKRTVWPHDAPDWYWAAVWEFAEQYFGGEAFADFVDAFSDAAAQSGEPDVWAISTEACPDAHFATFPRKLVRPMILAGTSEKGCCPGCGAPWRRIVRKDRKPTRPGKESKIRMPRGWAGNGVPHKASEWNRSKEEVGNRDPMRHVTEIETVGWGPSCDCPEQPPVPCLVLDCFNGSGKTGEQALLLGRSYVGMDLSWEYLSTIAVDRLERGLRPHKPRGRPVADPEGQNSLFDIEGV